MSHINIKTIEYNGRQIPITADDTGNVWVGDRNASKPVTVDGLTFVWASKKDGLPSGAKIALNQPQVFAVEQHAKEHRDACHANAKKARDFDNVINEGGEGYNPYRQ